MKKIVIVLACSLMFVGCDARRHESTSSTGFAMGASREDILRQLKESHARVLTNTPELLVAELKRVEGGPWPVGLLKKPLKVEMAFSEEKIVSVNYIQP